MIGIVLEQNQPLIKITKGRGNVVVTPLQFAKSCKCKTCRSQSFETSKTNELSCENFEVESKLP